MKKTKVGFSPSVFCCPQLFARCSSILFAAFVGIGVLTPRISIGVGFMGLGDLPEGVFNSRVFDMTPDGRFIVGSSSSADGEEAYLWSITGGMTGLGDLTGGIFRSQAFGVSDDGSVVVGVAHPGGVNNEAFRWTIAIGMVGLGDFDGGSFDSKATDVSADGSVVIGQGTDGGSDGGGGPAFRWTQADGLQSLGSLGTGYSEAFGVSADGSVVVGNSRSASGNEAFMWTEANGILGLGDLPGGTFASNARGGVSADGLVIAGQSTSARTQGGEAFRWTQETGLEALGDLPGGIFDSKSYAISADGSVIGGGGNRDTNADRAFIWDAERGMRNVREILLASGVVDVANWELHSVRALSADGQIIAGDGLNPNGDSEGWIAVIPEPGTPPEDLNMDGFVDSVDLGILLGNWKKSVPPSGGELDARPPVDGEDLGILLGAWDPPPRPGTSLVPEPSALLLGAMAGMGLMLGRLRQVR